jgi:hypothetical protein
MNADLILFNGQFHTVDREKPLASAVAIRTAALSPWAAMPRPWPCAVRPRK